MFKSFIQKKLEKYVQQYFEKHPEVKLVVVAGSIGKTSTKRAIATILSERYRVRLHEGNHNTHLSAPLGILGIEYPGDIRNIGAWLSVFLAARRRIHQPTDTDVIVQELGTDRPGDIPHFGTYLKPDIAVITAVTPEHMEFFGDMPTVAQEELAAANYAREAIINRDDIDGIYADMLTNPAIDTYGTTAAAEYRFEVDDFEINAGYTGEFIAPEFPQPVKASIKLVGEHSLRPVLGAAAVATKLGLLPNDIANGMAKVRAVPGRMNLLRGIGETIIIDDSYNSSPVAAASALQTLYGLQVPERIAILGSMNELGATSQMEHERLGELCDPGLLAWVITVGDDAEKWLAPKARARGCQVKSFKSAIEAGGFARSVAEPGAAILLKGSQGGIYLEEAAKVLCLMSDDIQLVRQSPEWIKTKDDFFQSLSR